MIGHDGLMTKGSYLLYETMNPAQRVALFSGSWDFFLEIASWS